jgi:hypothetical protein
VNVKSLAGTDKVYVEVQGRVRNGLLHIQGRGPEGNRLYGVAVDLPIDGDFATWLDGQTHSLQSLADTGHLYLPMQVRVADTIRLQVPGTEFNRPYGAAVRFPITDETEPLVDWINRFTDEGPEDLDEYDDDCDEGGEVTITRSLAARKYVAVQVAVNPDGESVHLQARGPEGNRSYGIALDLEIPADVASWIKNQEHTLVSLADTGREYVPAQACTRDGDVHFQVPGTKLNRSYGASFNVSSDAFASWLADCLA